MSQSFDIAELIERLRDAGVRCDTRQYLAANQVFLSFAQRGRDLTVNPQLIASHLGPIFSASPEDQRIVRETLLSLTNPPPPPPPPSAPERPNWMTRILRRPGPGTLAFAGVLLVVIVAAAWILAWYFGRHSVDGRILAEPIDDQKPVLSAAAVTYGDERVAVAADGSFRIQTYRAQPGRILRASLVNYAVQTLIVNYRTHVPIQLTLDPLRRVPPTPSSPYKIREPVVIAGGSVVTMDLGPAAIPLDLLLPIALAAFGLVLAGLEFFHGRRRGLALKRMTTVDADSALLTLRPPPPLLPIPPSLLRRMGADFRRARVQEAMGFSVEATVDATARAGGLVQPVSVARTASPEYLVLIDRRGAEDHAASVIGGWMDQLIQFGVAIDYFYFSQDPRVCWNKDSPAQRRRLSELLARHHGASVLLFAETALCIESISGQPTPWARSLRALPRCALLTLEPSYRWSRDERTMVDAGYVVLPATLRGLQMAATLGNEWQQPQVLNSAYTRGYPSLMAGDDERWLDRNAPPPQTVEKLLVQLHGYLGPKGYTWLCACAIYPQISWSITLSLLEVLVAGDEIGRRHAIDDQLPSLSRLSWFRYGYMPDWLRRLLIASLPADKERALRRHLDELLFALLGGREEHAPVPPSESRGSERPAMDLRLWLNPLDIAAAAPAGSPLRDAVFLGFIGRADLDPLALRVSRLPPTARPRPRSFARYLYGRWRLLVVHRPRAMRWLIAVAAGAVTFAAPLVSLQPVSQQTPPQPFAVTRVLQPLSTLPPLVGVAQSDRSPLFQLSPDGTTLAVSVGTSGILLANAETAQTEVVLPSAVPVARLTFNGNGSLLAALGLNGSTSLWDSRTRSSREMPFQNATAIEISTDGRRLAFADPPRLAVYDTASDKPLAAFSIGVPPASMTVLSPGGDFVATTDGQGSVNVWDTQSGRRVREVRATAGKKFNRLAISADGHWLAAGIFNPSSGNERLANEVGPNAPPFRQSQGNLIQLWDLTGRITSLPEIEVALDDFDMGFSPRGGILAVRQTKSVSFFDLEHGGARLNLVPSDAQKGVITSAVQLLAIRFAASYSNPGQLNFEVLQWPVEPESAAIQAQDAGNPRLQLPAPVARPASAPQGKNANARPAAATARTNVQPRTTQVQNVRASPSPQSTLQTAQVPMQAQVQPQSQAPVAQTTVNAPASEFNSTGVVTGTAPAAANSDNPATQSTGRPMPPTGLTVDGVASSGPAALQLEQSSYLTQAQGETVSIKATNGQVLGDFRAILKTNATSPAQLPASGEATVFLRGISRPPITDQQPSFDEYTQSINLARDLPGTRYSRRVGLLNFTVSVVADSAANSSGLTLKIDVSIAPSASAK